MSTLISLLRSYQKNNYNEATLGYSKDMSDQQLI